MKLAAVTMVYNEPEYLPLWQAHYARAVGAEHCFIVDHGSTDGSTAHPAGASVLRLPRSPHDDRRRARFVSGLCAALLQWYDAVIHTDVDELVVADPRRFASLAACAAALDDTAATAIGFNLLQLPHEPPLDPARPLGAQRHWAWFTSAMCKPVLIRRPVAWSPGFHSCDHGVAFAPLYLFHLRYADRAIALARLARTRQMPWADLAAGAHQRVTDQDFTDMLGRLERMDRVDPADFDPAAPGLATLLDRVIASQHGREGQTYRIDLAIDNYRLWRIPPWLGAALGA